MLYRKQIMMEPEIWNRLVVISEDQRTSVSEILRRAAVKEIKKVRSVKKVNAAEVMLRTMKKIKRLGLSKGPSDLSVNHDHYIYGWPKKY